MTAQLKPITGMRESVEDLNGEITEYSYVTPDDETMRELTRLLFEEHWREIVVGPCIEFERAAMESTAAVVRIAQQVFGGTDAGVI